MPPQDILNYLSRYQYILNKPQSGTLYPQPNPYPNCIWQFWWQGEDQAPLLVKKCMASVQRHADGRRVIVLSKYNISQYLTIPDVINKSLKKGVLTLTQLSDYIRTALLAQYGGTWLDATVYLTGKIPPEITQETFFHLKSLAWTQMEQVPTAAELRIYNRLSKNWICSSAGSSWFLHAAPGSIIMNKLKLLWEEYWDKEPYLIHYFLWHYMLTMAITHDADCAMEYNQMRSLSNMNPHLLQFSLRQPYDSEVFDFIRKKSSFHKLTYKNSKIFQTPSFITS